MLYSILIYGDEDRVAAWTPEEDQEVMGRHAELRRDLTAGQRLGPVMRLEANAAKIVRRYKDRNYITDGPFTETKEQLMGIYVIDCPAFEDAIAATERLSFESNVFVIRPVTWLSPGVIPPTHPE
jgi:hypothetical protein